MASRVQDLYREDFYAWTRDQAGELRRLAELRPNGELDWANLIVEVEDLGQADLLAVESQLRRVIEHCLKLRFSTAVDPRRGWLNSIDDARERISDRLIQVLRADAEPQLARLHAQVLRRVRRDLAACGETEAAAALPADCPFTFDQLIDPDWYPEQPG